MLTQDNTSRGTGQFEIRVDGVSTARHTLIEAALREALNKKQSLSQQLVTLHDLRFERAWAIDRSGRVMPTAGSLSISEASWTYNA